MGLAMSPGMSRNIPIMVIDDFFENPDEVVNFANSLEYEKDPNHSWPGYRSKPLYYVNKNFYDLFCYKFFSLFVDVQNDSSIRWESSLFFQKVSNEYGNGWTHTDVPLQFTAIVYLNKNYTLNSGTSIMAKKSLTVDTPWNQKEEFYKTGIETDATKQSKEYIEKQFEESIVVRNRYNRMVAFESHLYHKAQDFDTDEERLTLIMFVSKLYSARSPIQNMRRFII